MTKEKYLVKWRGTASKTIGLLKTIYASKHGTVGFLILLIYLFMAFFGSSIRPLDTTPKPGQMYLPPSIKYPLGTDNQGRDTLSFIVNGTFDVLYISLVASMVSVILAVLVGSVSGFKGGTVDSILMYISDIILNIPQFPLMAVLSGLMRLTDVSLAMLMGVLSWPSLAKAIRSQVLSLKERDFIEAARLLDLGTRHIVFTELMPNLMPYIAVSFALAMTYSIYNYVGLVFLGFVPFRAYNWGVMINHAWVLGAIYNRDSILWILSPIIAIVGLEVGVIMFSRGLELAFNPRLRK
ncbi:MAG: peptide ABC transporter permease [Candidatus Bathyarchaeota archaeon B24]|nr:MAG: peptide ABC transporter permease [Candidatus Bathyarchaeota archaeon B24]